ncbi:helix-turn-helix domain-containing protein [Jiella sp. 40Bstr34]|uniref:Helix-turn-helix domain-containing protein n=2 Tax=Jiella pacifica TaxID=2696469 RepID=A0A6N9SZ84_9HYPH|nr:helix-turn-helix domain-containing protein [Jiella pacifica]
MLSETGENAPIRLSDIGARLRAFRMGRGLTPEAVAASLGISRAALYRAEKGEIPKIETLTRIADVLGTSLPSLLGVGVEYVDTAIAFFERMRQIEEEAEQIIGLFGPVSYLLTSDAYDGMLQEVMLDAIPPGEDAFGAARQSVDALMSVLRQRKSWYKRRQPLIVSLIASSDLERFLLHGALGRHDLPPETVAERRHLARSEVERIATMLRRPPPGVQIGIALEPTPATTFQIFRQRHRSTLAISPFRLGEQPNVRIGVALITSAPEPMRLHEDIARRLWEGALKGDAAADFLDGLLGRYGIDGKGQSSHF